MFRGLREMMNQDQALDWFAKVFLEPRDKINPETPREKIAGWDSLGVLMLMADLDENFNIVMSDQEMQSLKSVADVLSLLRERGQLC